MPALYQTTQIARPEFYDRNPVMSNTNFSLGGAAPHGVTNRTSYTVAANKKAWLDSLWLNMIRSALAGAAGIYQIIVQYTPSGGGAAALVYLYSVNNVVGTNTFLVDPTLGFMNVGDLIQLQTVDTSTGGTVDYTAAQKVTTFDA